MPETSQSLVLASEIFLIGPWDMWNPLTPPHHHHNKEDTNPDWHRQKSSDRLSSGIEYSLHVNTCSLALSETSPSSLIATVISLIRPLGVLTLATACSSGHIRLPLVLALFCLATNCTCRLSLSAPIISKVNNSSLNPDSQNLLTALWLYCQFVAICTCDLEKP